jgi:hypothetical protein
MSIPILSELVPKATGVFPVADISNVRGGYWSVPTVADRDSIGANLRKQGMLVHVQSNGLSYRLVGGIDNANWSLDAGSTNYYATGIVAASSWNITHNLGYNPSVTITDSTGNLHFGQIRYLTSSSLQIIFTQNVTGTGYFS